MIRQLLFFLATDAAADVPLWKELWEFFKEKYFNMDSYEHINVSGTGLNSLPQIIIAFTIGFILAALAAVINKNVLGDFVRVLLQNECHDPDKAKTLEELGYHKNTTIRSSLKRGVNLRRVVHCLEEEQFAAEVEKERAAYEKEHENDPSAPKFKAPEFKMDLDTMHFYIHHEDIYMADVKFEKKGTDWVMFAATVVGSVVVMCLVFYFLPDLFQMLDNMIGMIKGSGNSQYLN